MVKSVQQDFLEQLVGLVLPGFRENLDLPEVLVLLDSLARVDKLGLLDQQELLEYKARLGRQVHQGC